MSGDSRRNSAIITLMLIPIFTIGITFGTPQLAFAGIPQDDLGSIHIFGFLDEDGDGVQDLDEGAFPDDPGKTFEIINGEGILVATQTTSAGIVGFENLAPGEYTVRENPIPAGFELTTLPNERTFMVTSGQELVYEDGAANIPGGSTKFETNLGDELKWGNEGKPLNNPIGGTVGSMSTTSLLVAGAQANMGLWSLALVGIVGAAAAITYKKKSKKTK